MPDVLPPRTSTFLQSFIQPTYTFRFSANRSHCLVPNFSVFYPNGFLLPTLFVGTTLLEKNSLGRAEEIGELLYYVTTGKQVL